MQRHIEFIAVPRRTHRVRPLRHPLRVAVLAPRADLRTARDGVPGGVGSFNRRGSSHLFEMKFSQCFPLEGHPASSNSTFRPSALNSAEQHSRSLEAHLKFQEPLQRLFVYLSLITGIVRIAAKALIKLGVEIWCGFHA